MKKLMIALIGLCLIAALSTAHEYLCRGCCLWERVLAVHLLDEVLSEGDEKQDADDTS